MLKSSFCKFVFFLTISFFVIPLHLLYAEIIVSVTSPADDSSFPVGSDITLTADVQVIGGTLRDVRFFSKNTTIGKANASTLSYTWVDVKAGNYFIFARVRDTDGNQVDSDTIRIHVGNISRGDLIINGSFDKVLIPWSIQNNEGASSTLTRRAEMYFNDSAYAFIDITNGGTADWHVQMLQTFPIKNGHTYEVNFWADSEAPKTITVAMQQSSGSYTTYLWQGVEIDGTALYGPVTYDCTVDDPTSNFKFCVGGNLIDISFDEVQVIDRTLTSVSSHELFNKNGVISTFELFNNYPNPFNMNTSIQYRLTRTANVNLDVFNVQGQLVKSLVNDNINAGLYTANWDGTDNSNSIVPSGVYVFRLSIPGERMQLTRKVLLLK